MVKVGIVGGTGYTGAELLRVLASHPEVEVAAISSRAEAGKRVDEYFPNLRSVYELEFCDPSSESIAACDIVFFATPHGVAQASANEYFSRGQRIIDLSADFRIKDIALWEKWYNQEHACPELVDKAVYGLPEVNHLAALLRLQYALRLLLGYAKGVYQLLDAFIFRSRQEVRQRAGDFSQAGLA